MPDNYRRTNMLRIFLIKILNQEIKNFLNVDDVSYFARRSTKASKDSLNHLIALDSTREMRAQCTYNPLKKQSVQSRDGVWFLMLLLPRITIFAPI
jgi:hypothetical protein